MLTPAHKLKSRYIYFAVAIICSIALYISIKNLFFFDEDVFVTNINSTLISDKIQRSPVITKMFKLDNYFWHTNPVGYHLEGILFHLINAGLALLVFKELLKLLSTKVSAFQLVAMPFLFFVLFLLSPIHSEPLCYILGRCGSVVSCFSLLSIFFFLKANQKFNGLYGLSLGSFLLALFCYEVSWLLPCIILSILFFKNLINAETIKKNIVFAVPYFMVFILWFLVKIVIVNKFMISDYSNKSLFTLDFVRYFKNAVILFLRNFVPPFNSAIIFVVVSALFLLSISIGLFKMYKQNRALFYLCILLLALTIFSFLPTVLLGINSHTSESERYIYFSSSFALMFLSVFIVTVFTKKYFFYFISSALILFDAYVLFTAINYYKTAGNFSNLFLQTINKKITPLQTVYFINMPIQYQGALMLRAKSRLNGNKRDDITVMQEYLLYLYDKKIASVNLSNKKLIKVPIKLVEIEKPLDSLSTYFPQFIFNSKHYKIEDKQNDNEIELDSQAIVVALNGDKIFYFK